MFELGNLQGIIPIVGGVYGYLLATGALPKNPRDPEKMNLWRKKFGPMMKIIGPILVIVGIFQLLGAL